ncbi:hypothetical protein HMT_41 [Clostridium phage HM T]|uniref:Uncharacterized protein n=1 Tax=Clostridium saccharoperbutylacetonicum N1-4(HMT) TaxID=931276 RepID=M1LPN0_9CLOT|nr:hypothetical protein [Clostridium saccharoperbutylacetonicum]AMB17453.1 hypothetical protein HMT_41 [Clostridium phage HM T]AGF54805.1 hypothetical protein Cspa_c10290 [Clostridium saccharoperbutylacetonicum N1-4(HMT)]NRT58674.1 hypothetical protein [Clostridium saccharoperbutylacetonicum]NRT64490.1 hypothetical protein [Clostridium saccharoperbutylacetonicum]NSB27863.1 hypothetical protein [Clostridium saccharoperbutylacetonicum]
MEENIKVYVKVDSNNVITQVDSSIFLFNVEDWVKIDEGQGDKFSHAQGNYLDKPLVDMQGKYNYKLMDGKIVDLTDEEKEKLFPTVKQELSLVDRIAMLENLQLQQGGLV